MTTHQTAKTQYIATPDGATTFAYRRFGTPSTDCVPLLFLIHFRGTMDKWDPLLINSIAAHREVILVDYVGLGQSIGRVATSVRDSAADIAHFLGLIKVEEVDVLGFSIGGIVVQMLALNHSNTKAQKETLNVRKIIVAGSSATVGPDMPETENDYITAATAATLAVEGFKHLFFPHNEAGEKAAEEWWARIAERNETASGEVPSDWGSQGLKDGGVQLKAQGEAYGKFMNAEQSQGLEGSYGRLAELTMPVLVAQGSDDFMFPTINSFLLQQKVPYGQAIIYPNSGHGFLYQYAETFAKHVGIFLDA